MRKHIKKYLLITVGILAIILGLIGAVLPVLPTTPFLILALACFANSSPHFHQQLLNNRWFGEALQQWEENRSISRKAKTKAILLVILSFSISITMLQGRLHLQLGLLILAIVLLSYLWKLKEADKVKIPITKR